MFSRSVIEGLKTVSPSKGTDVGRANKHGIFIATNLYIVAVDFASLSSQSGVCFISNKKKGMCRVGALPQLIAFAPTGTRSIVTTGSYCK